MKTVENIAEALDAFLEEFNEQILDQSIVIKFWIPEDSENDSERLRVLSECGLLNEDDFLKRKDSWKRVELYVWTDNFIIFTHEYDSYYDLKVLPRNPIKMNSLLVSNGVTFMYHLTDHCRQMNFSEVYRMIGE